MVLGVLLAAGVFSGAVSSQAQIWWNKAGSSDTPRVAHVINDAPGPLVITEPNRNLLTLSSLLKPNARIYVARKSELKKLDFDFVPLAQDDGAIFLYDPPQFLLDKLRAKNAPLTKSDADEPLWKIGRQRF